MIRNFYCVVYTTSEIDLIPNDKKKEKQYENYTICKKCGELRSPRSHHCSICNLCIDKLDHHCIFLTNLHSQTMLVYHNIYKCQSFTFTNISLNSAL